jgi:hypothetical protein
MSPRQVFVTGGTGYIGSRLIPMWLERGHGIAALARPGSQSKLPSGCTPVLGNALDGDSYAQHLAACDTFIQLVGVAHPSPAKAREFVEIDQKSAMEDSGGRASRHRAFRVCERGASRTHDALLYRGPHGLRKPATVERPERHHTPPLVCAGGPGHRWPYVLIPFYWLAERIPSKRDAAGCLAW